MLSTSQTPVRGEFIEVKKHPELISAGGGFGPVDDKGYGVSYIITGEDNIFFHVSCKKSCQTTVRISLTYNFFAAKTEFNLILGCHQVCQKNRKGTGRHENLTRRTQK